MCDDVEFIKEFKFYGMEWVILEKKCYWYVLKIDGCFLTSGPLTPF